MKRVVLLCLIAIAAFAQSGSQTYAVIITGLGGEKDYDKEFKNISERIATSLKKSGIPAANVTLLPVETSQKEKVARVFQELVGKAHPADTLLVFLVGHGTYDGQVYKMNLPGPDPTAADFKAWFDKVPATKQVIVNATSSSGATLETWARPGRVVITSTRNGQERNATIFMRFFAESLSDPAADQDKNGSVSALEAFRYAEQRVAKFYEGAARIATEHAMLDDNGSGKGVKDPGPQNGEGLVAATVPLVRFVGANAPVDSPETRELRAKKEKIENDIAALKYNKASMNAAEYAQQLEKLLIELSRTQQALDKVESGTKQ